MKEHIRPAIFAALVGVALFRWEAIANLLGLPVTVERTGAVLTFEYWLGLLIAGPLGYMFPKKLQPAICAVLLMLGPVLFWDAAVLTAWHA